MTNSPDHVIRGNVISGNGTANNNLTGYGIAIVVPTPTVDPLAEQKYGNHIIAGNFIGTNAAGSAAIPNLRPESRSPVRPRRALAAPRPPIAT